MILKKKESVTIFALVYEKRKEIPKPEETRFKKQTNKKNESPNMKKSHDNLQTRKNLLI